jgi:hypothetical protein
MIQVFIGYDARQPVSFHVLTHSLLKRSSKPLAITPLVLGQLALRRVGLTPFTFSRFLVPELMKYEGWAVFMDIDMMVRADIAELMALADDRYTVMVSKNQLRFEWTSLMLMNCRKCSALTFEYVENADGLHKMTWVADEEIGELPGSWNHLVGYDEPDVDAKLVHFTQGIPAFPETADCEFGEEWRQEAGEAFSSISWQRLMGPSVHAKPVLMRMAEREVLKKEKVA